MNRRDTLGVIVALCAAPRARAQSARKLPRIALVDGAEAVANMAEDRHPLWGPLLSELRRLGYIEGKTVAIERWSGGGDTGGYGELARKIVASRPQIIVARGRTLTSPIAATTSDIPIVTVGTVSSDLSTSLARPSGNVTGLFTSADEQQIYSKQLDFLAEIVKVGSRIAWLGPQLLWDGPVGEAARKGATRQKLVLRPIFVSSPVDAKAIGEAFAAIRSGKFEGLLISPSTEIFPHRVLIAKLALEGHLPSMSTSSFYVEAGILSGYGAPTDELFRRAAHYVSRLLKGAKPGDLPIEQPTKILLMFNRKTAKALGISIPPSMLLQADRVIE